MKHDSFIQPDHYVSAFERFTSNGGGNVPGWLAETRRDAMSKFVEAGFPTTRQEAWRFTDLAPILRQPFALPAGPAPEVTAEFVAAHRVDPDIPVAVVVNGRFDAALSQLDGLTPKLVVTSLEDAIRSHASVVERHLTRYVRDAENPFASLSNAFVADGTFIYVPRDVQAGTVQVLCIAAPRRSDPMLLHPRALVVVEAGAVASVIETYVSAGSGLSWTNAVTELAVADNAQLAAYRVQDEAVSAFHTAGTWSHQRRDSRLTTVVFTFGGSLTRHNLVGVMDGDGAECTINGLSVLAGRQHVDYHTALDHASPHCRSWEYFNGIFDERSRGVFNGRIIVRPGAQKTDAKQTNNNLLLSPTARADSQPQLEIYADDVKCTHGATLGPIDQAHLFYLQSRGLSLADARMLLTYGFASEILNTVDHAVLRERLDRHVQSRLRGRRG